MGTLTCIVLVMTAIVFGGPWAVRRNQDSLRVAMRLDGFEEPGIKHGLRLYQRGELGELHEFCQGVLRRNAFSPVDGSLEMIEAKIAMWHEWSATGTMLASLHGATEASEPISDGIIGPH
jgi:hypothetical protein